MRLWDNAIALKRLYRWLYLCIALCLLTAGGIWLVHSSYFPVRQIKVAEPLKHVQTAEIESISKKYLYGNIFTVNVNAARTEFAKLPWVAKAHVKRIWPDTVLLKINERTPIARRGNRQLVDANGELFEAQLQDNLPLLVGSESSVRFMAMNLLIFENLLQPTGLHIHELHLSNRSAWDIVLDNGISLRLGRENVETRLSRFVWAWPQVLHSQAKDIDYVDLRYPDGFALRYKNKPQLQDSVSEPSAVNMDSIQSVL
ncbi:MAG: cell division protein FtsQ/DivIB [Snodgrassella sp.]|nr:cell division protein FtsQ/DivIB [Snodgrassella sp.]